MGTSVCCRSGQRSVVIALPFHPCVGCQCCGSAVIRYNRPATSRSLRYGIAQARDHRISGHLLYLGDDEKCSGACRCLGVVQLTSKTATRRYKLYKSCCVMLSLPQGLQQTAQFSTLIALNPSTATQPLDLPPTQSPLNLTLVYPAAGQY